ncbi:MAG: YdeI/OmpD-associated family protein [bacterium]|nr:YdeI/OmpD-associated family protein [bacterium]
MSQRRIAPGVVHGVPADLRKALTADRDALTLWEDITPLARNEWICWVEDARKPETRLSRIERVRAELKEGMRRPCCWPGCPHRGKKASAPASLNRNKKPPHT